MKKLILLWVSAAIVLGFAACKKDNNNGGDTPAPQVKCKLKSLKEVSKSSSGTENSGFVLYYDATEKVTRANFIDTITGNEDSTSYALLSYSGDNLTDVKIFQNGSEFINFAMTYDNKNKVTQRFFDFPTIFGLAKITQTYFYDNQGRLSYTIRTTVIDNVPQVGKVTNKDSAIYQNYTSFNRPLGVLVYTSTTTSQGTQPYEFEEELKYDYDAKGNRIKISAKEDVSDPFETIYSATFDPAKTAGEGEAAYRLLTKLFIDDWDDPNLNSADIDLNLLLSETEYEDGLPNGTTTTTYTFNDRGNPATSTETASSDTKTTTFNYECK